MLDWVLGRREDKGGKSSKRKRQSYEKSKKIAAEGAVEERRELAAHEDLEPELLYYFASDESREVRREVARNEGTPLQADKILSKDTEDEVRLELARKIGRLVPTFKEEEQERLVEMAIEVLEALAQDQLPLVRAIISEEIKSAKNVPSHIVQKLARDVEAIVSAPVLEYSPLLSAEDLLNLIADGVGDEVLAALSRRKNLIETVASAIVKTRSIEATKALLNNKTAKISDETLGIITTIAVAAVELHKPIVQRENLPLRMIRRIASFVSATLVETLIKRSGLDKKLAAELRQSVRHRIEEGDSDSVEEDSDRELADERAKRMFAEGKLNEKIITKAIEEKDLAFVRHALALMAGIGAETAKEMLASGSGKAICALAWKAGLGMRVAMALQTRVANLKPKDMLKASGDGFPLSEEDLVWYIDYFSS